MFAIQCPDQKEHAQIHMEARPQMNSDMNRETGRKRTQAELQDQNSQPTNSEHTMDKVTLTFHLGVIFWKTVKCSN